MGAIGPLQIILVLLLVLLLFGAGKLPRLMGDMGKGINAFKRGLKDEDASDAAEDVKKVSSDADIDGSVVDVSEKKTDKKES